MPHEQKGRTEAGAEEDHEVQGEAISVLDLERQVLKRETVFSVEITPFSTAIFNLNLTEPGGSTPWPLRRAIVVENWRVAAFTKERANTVILDLEF